jgi:hypothetical protein
MLIGPIRTPVLQTTAASSTAMGLAWLREQRSAGAIIAMGMRRTG